MQIMIRNCQLVFVVLAVASLLGTACSRKEAPVKEWHAQVNVGYATKAVEVDGDYLHSYWEADDPVMVVYSNGVSYDHVGTLTATPASGVRPTGATLAGTVLGIYGVGSHFDLYYPRISRTYDDQGGTEESVSSNFSYFVAGTTVTAVSGQELTLTPAVFQPCQAYLKLLLEREDHTPINYTQVRFSNGRTNGTLLRSQSSPNAAPSYGNIFVNPTGSTATGEVFLAVHDDTDAADEYTITAWISGTQFKKSITVHLEDGHYYTGTVTMVQE